MIHLTSAEEDTSGRGAQTDAVLQPRQAEARSAGNGQQTQQSAKAGSGNEQHRNGGSHVMVEEKDSLGLVLRVLVTGLEGMRMHDDDPVHHMRVGEQRHSSPIRQEQQGKKKLHDTAQLLQNVGLRLFEGAKIRLFARTCKLLKQLFQERRPS